MISVNVRLIDRNGRPAVDGTMRIDPATRNATIVNMTSKQELLAMIDQWKALVDACIDDDGYKVDPTDTTVRIVFDIAIPYK